MGAASTVVKPESARSADNGEMLESARKAARLERLAVNRASMAEGRRGPSGECARAAGSHRRRLSDEINDVRGFESATRLNTIEAYQTYIRAFPGGSKVAAAMGATAASEATMFNLLMHELRSRLVAIIGWGVGLAAFGAMVAHVSQ